MKQKVDESEGRGQSCPPHLMSLLVPEARPLKSHSQQTSLITVYMNISLGSQDSIQVQPIAKYPYSMPIQYQMILIPMEHYQRGL